jgi:hypothetical protein
MCALKKGEPYVFSKSIQAELDEARKNNTEKRVKREQDAKERQKAEASLPPNGNGERNEANKTVASKFDVTTVVIIAVLVIIAIIIYRSYRRRLPDHPTYMRVPRPTQYHKTLQEEEAINE